MLDIPFLLQIDSPFHQLSYFDDDDDYDDVDVDDVEAMQPPSSSSKLQSAFSYKPKRVDFKSYLKEVNRMESIKSSKHLVCLLRPQFLMAVLILLQKSQPNKQTLPVKHLRFALQATLDLLVSRKTLVDKHC